MQGLQRGPVGASASGCRVQREGGPTSKTSHLEFGAVADLLASEGLQGTCYFIYRAKRALLVSLGLAFELIKQPPSVMLNATSASEGRKETTN